jgi:phosphatidate cytidylyltransferase
MMTSILNRYNNLTQRIVAALIGATVLIGALWLGPVSYFFVFLLLMVMTQLEFYTLTGLDGMIPLKTFGTISGSLLFIIIYLVESSYLRDDYYFLLFPIVMCIFLIKLYRPDDKKPFTSIAFTILGIIYVALPFSLMSMIVFRYGDYNPLIAIGILLILWASDTGAYFAGTRFGKRKLFERISPKKSWEGSIGGTILALLMAILVGFNFELLPLWQWIGVAVLIVVGGTYGDLVESLFKRSILIKDSGSLIPGHGGFLDRFDSLLLAVPFIVAFLKLFY